MTTRNDRATWIKGGIAQCSLPPKLRLHPPRLVLLGAPGVGKGTQAELLCTGLEICHLATQHILSAGKCLPDDQHTPALQDALQQLRHGAPVSEQGVLKLVTERLTCLHCRGGFLLDGFPRTVSQAEVLEHLLLEKNLHLDAVLNYTLPYELLIKRLSGRLTCQECQASFNLEIRQPQKADVCDYCGGVLMQREDDLPAAVAERVLAYEQETKPLIDFYLGRGLVRTISAEGTAERIYQRTLSILDN